jgi:peptidoglycan hydrolase CwlO-like protein
MTLQDLVRSLEIEQRDLEHKIDLLQALLTKHTTKLATLQRQSQELRDVIRDSGLMSPEEEDEADALPNIIFWKSHK